MLPPFKPSEPTAPTSTPKIFDQTHIQHAIAQARLGLTEGGIPIGAALVSAEGVVLGVGRNRRVQKASAIRHGEIDCLENVGRLPATMYKGSTMYTTLSPCSMCAGAIILFGIKKVVIGENSTFLGEYFADCYVVGFLTDLGGEEILRERDVEIINLDLPECKALMAKFIELKPDVWNEDIGED